MYKSNDIKHFTLTLTVLVLSCAPLISAHVALTYPPARKYDLDFLDNSRTKGPCGMPKGESSNLSKWKYFSTYLLIYLVFPFFVCSMMNRRFYVSSLTNANQIAWNLPSSCRVCMFLHALLKGVCIHNSRQSTACAIISVAWFDDRKNVAILTDLLLISRIIIASLCFFFILLLLLLLLRLRLLLLLFGVCYLKILQR